MFIINTIFKHLSIKYTRKYILKLINIKFDNLKFVLLFIIIKIQYHNHKKKKSFNERI